MSANSSIEADAQDTRVTFRVVMLILFLYALNNFLPIQPQLLAINISLGLLLLFTLLIRYKQSLLYLLALCVPVSFQFSPGGGARISFPAEIICAALSIFFVAKILSGTKLSMNFLKHPLTVLILADLGWLFITSCFSEMPEVSFKRLIIKSAFYISFYYFVHSLFTLDRRSVSGLFLLHCLGLCIPVFYTLYRHSYIGFQTMGSQLYAQPFYNDHTMYGAALAFVLPFCFTGALRKEQSNYFRAACFALFLLFSVAVFYSFSRAAWLSLIISAGFALLLWIRIRLRTVIAGSLILATVAAFNYSALEQSLSRNKQRSHSNDLGSHFKSVSNINNDDSNRERLNRWKCAIKMFADKPVLGFGPGTYQFFYGNYQVASDLSHLSSFNGSKGHAHSEYLNYLSETGLPGFLIFIGIVVTAFARGIRCCYAESNEDHRLLILAVLTGLCTFFVHAFFNGFLEFDKLSMPVMMGFAAITFFDQQRKKQALTR